MKRFLPLVIWLSYAVLLGWVSFRSSILWWLTGIVIAVMLFIVDQLLYAMWLKPFEQLSLQIQYWWQRHDYVAVFKLIQERGHEQSKLILHSLVFMAIWPLLTIYLLTSSGNITSLGVVMGLGLGLATDVIHDWQNYRHLRRWLCWQIKREMSESEVRIVAGAFVVIFVIITIVLLARG